MDLSCTIVGGIKEDHSKPIYCVAFSNDLYNVCNEDEQNTQGDIDEQTNQKDKANKEMKEKNPNKDTNLKSSHLCRLMATCGSNHLTMYEVDETNHFSKGCGMRPIQAYIDVDADEVFYTCLFLGRGVGSSHGYKPCQETDFINNDQSRHEQDDANNNNESYEILTDFSTYDGPQLCCVAGTRGIIKVIDTVRMKLLLTLSGHGNEIFDMSLCPIDEWLLLSASKDESLRLWNVQNAQCLAIFAGHEGHRDAILSVDWHPLGHMFASGGMDEQIKIWSVKKKEIQQAIEKDKQGDETFRTVYEQLPIFSSSMLHTNYVDCVQFVGDLILSKSSTNYIVLWKPDLSESSSTRKSDQDDANYFFSPSKCSDKFSYICDFDCNHCEVWYVRFGTNQECSLLAIGNNVGDLRLFHIDSRNYVDLVNFNAQRTIRQVIFSPDGLSIIAVSDDSAIWRWVIEHDDNDGSTSQAMSED